MIVEHIAKLQIEIRIDTTKTLIGIIATAFYDSWQWTAAVRHTYKWHLQLLQAKDNIQLNQLLIKYALQSTDFFAELVLPLRNEISPNLYENERKLWKKWQKSWNLEMRQNEMTTTFVYMQMLIAEPLMIEMPHKSTHKVH